MTPSNANTSGLAPCPFCGDEAWLNDYEAKYSDLPPMSRAPQCRSCGASLGYLTTPAKATEAWNRRVTAASAQARIAELEAENDVLKVEVIGLRAAIFGSHDYDPSLRQGNFIEMARATENGRHGALARATAAEARADRLAKVLEPFARVARWARLCGVPDLEKATAKYAKRNLFWDQFSAADAALHGDADHAG